jgi:hypothetical protein
MDLLLCNDLNYDAPTLGHMFIYLQLYLKVFFCWLIQVIPRLKASLDSLHKQLH